MILAALAAAAVTLQPPAEAPVPPAPLPPDPACATAGACRHVDAIRVRVAGARTGTLRVGRDIPWLGQGGEATLFLGETAVYRLDPNGDGYKLALVAVGEAATSHALAANEIRLALAQQDDLKVTLAVENKSQRAFHYDALVVAGRNVTTAPTCAVSPNIAMVENWTDPVVQVIVQHFKPTDRLGCWSDLR